MPSDLRFAARTLLKSPAFTITAIATLALGIGANTAIFGLVNQVLLNPPGIANPERVIAVQVSYDKLNLRNIGVSATDFADVRDCKEAFEHASAMTNEELHYSGVAMPERLKGAAVNAGWFAVFGAQPMLGRVFRPEEDEPNANSVVVLSHAAWVRVLGADRNVVGKTILLNQKPYLVAGVMGPAFRWPRQVDAWVPLGLARSEYTEQNRFNEGMFAYARMKPGLTFDKANAYVHVLAGRTRNAQNDSGAYARDSGWTMAAVPVTDVIAADTKMPMLVLMGAVGFVLLIACANIAGLLLARTAGRVRDTAVRSALGASPWQLLRPVLAESVLLAGAAAAAGIALAYFAMKALLLVAPQDAVAGLHARIDLRVLSFTAGVSVLAALFFSVAPAWQISRVAPFLSLKGSARSSAPGFGRHGVRAMLVVFETALALVLLVGAGLFLRSLARLQEVSPGFDARGVMTASVALPGAEYTKQDAKAGFYRATVERLSAIPGAGVAAIGAPIPFSGMGASASFNIEGRVTGPGDPGPHSDLAFVTPGFFEAMGIPLKRGRVFNAQDHEGSAPAVVIDSNLAREYWPNEDPVGRHLRRGSRAAWSTIIGVVGHVTRSNLATDTGKGVAYYCIYQVPIPFASLVVKTQGDPSALTSVIREAVRAVDPNQPVYNTKTLEDMVGESLAPRRFVMRLSAFFAIVALFMAALGLYGLIAYSVTMRTQEIGIRMALGAQTRSVMALIIGQGARLAGFGVLLGAAGALVCSRLIRSELFEVSAFDPVTLGAMAVVLMAAAIVASYFPARRAVRIDPVRALRIE